ncbi:hypothetical protein EJ08DRAFT_692646 [Tothia fuscella]|uniref:Uncharacterized protein n=1 Tax=Tothia fuscella TaxID=1048955 RepID=A0A9P4U3X4_9PEZI|nr:hypothetical protein EJ08DRAFT_692646 [Tothia fuscella]
MRLNSKVPSPESIGMSTYKYEDLARSSLDEEEAEVLPSGLKRANFEDAPPERKIFRRIGYPISVVFNLLLFVFILFLLAQPCYFSSRTCIYRDRRKDTQLPLMADINEIVPEFPTTKITFQANNNYSSPTMFKNSLELDSILQNWASTMPLGRGFILVNHSSTYPALSAPWHLKSLPGADGYSIAYLHQFHCLYMIMRSHGDAKFGRRSHDEDMERHVTHCYDYLRQSIFCAGDAAMEGKSRVEGLEMTDGWGDMHVCKDPSVMGQWVLDHRFSNKKGID